MYSVRPYKLRELLRELTDWEHGIPTQKEVCELTDAIGIEIPKEQLSEGIDKLVRTGQYILETMWRMGKTSIKPDDKCNFD